MTQAVKVDMTHVARIQVLMSEDEAERFDAYCREMGYKKSTLIARLVRNHMDKEGFQIQGEFFAGAGDAETEG